jgi:hypothetical protein
MVPFLRPTKKFRTHEIAEVKNWMGGCADLGIASAPCSSISFFATQAGGNIEA